MHYTFLLTDTEDINWNITEKNYEMLQSTNKFMGMYSIYQRKIIYYAIINVVLSFIEK